ncbi:MAG: copper chaperone PCu(A)C [Anaerolineae bacterium]
MSKLRIVPLILLVLATFGVAQAQFINPPELLIYDVWVRPTAPEPADGATPEAPIPGTVTGAYLTIENVSDTDYQLVGISAGFAEMSMLHQSTVDDKGVMRMQMVMGGLDIPAGEMVQLAPGGYHAMLMNVTADVYPGEAVPLTLTFADASGATFDRVVGAIATDFPPEDDGLIVANALAQRDPADPYSLDVSLVIDNRGDEADMLTGVASIPTTTPNLTQFVRNDSNDPDTVEIPAQAQTVFSMTGAIIRDNSLAQTPITVFPLTLSFQSGRSQTIAVPIDWSGAAS